MAARPHGVIQRAALAPCSWTPNLRAGQAAMTCVCGERGVYYRQVSSWFLHHS